MKTKPHMTEERVEISDSIRREHFKKVEGIGSVNHSGFIADVTDSWGHNKEGSGSSGCMLYVYHVSSEELIYCLGLKVIE